MVDDVIMAQWCILQTDIYRLLASHTRPCCRAHLVYPADLALNGVVLHVGLSGPSMARHVHTHQVKMFGEEL